MVRATLWEDVGVKELSPHDKSEDINDVKRSKNVQSKLDGRNKGNEVKKNVKSQFQSGRLFALITSRPALQDVRESMGQLCGHKVDFYVQKMQKKQASRLGSCGRQSVWCLKRWNTERERERGKSY